MNGRPCRICGEYISGWPYCDPDPTQEDDIAMIFHIGQEHRYSPDPRVLDLLRKIEKPATPEEKA